MPILPDIQVSTYRYVLIDNSNYGIGSFIWASHIYTIGDKATLLKLAYQASAAILANLSGVQALCDNDGVFHEIIKSGRNRIAETG